MVRKPTGRSLRALVLVALAVLIAALLSACGSSSSSSSSSTAAGGSGGGESTTAAAGSGGSEETASAGAKCGGDTGKPATGTPLKFGAIVTKQPGTDFTAMTGGANAYFQCLNENGGIHGHPVEYIVEEEQSNPQQVASLATKLVESDKVLALVGNGSLTDCAINAKFYEEQKLYVVVAGVSPLCFTSPNISGVNMGPAYSTLGATQFLVGKGVKSLVVSSAKVPGAEADNAPSVAYAESKGVSVKPDTETVPISNANEIALKLIDEAGEGGGVSLDYTPPEAIKILEAAESLGQAEKVEWACSTACNDPSVAAALGSAWSGKFYVNAEFALPTGEDPDDVNYRAVLEKYGEGTPVGAFSQMGMLAARFVSEALEKAPASDLTREGINQTIKGITGAKSTALCEPWYFGGLPAGNVSNNSDRTVVTQEGAFEETGGCFKIAPMTPTLKAVRKYEEANPSVKG